jgi:hypothetical protein
LPDLAYHVTPATNLSSILKDGLRPSIGERSKRLGETRPAVYLFTRPEALEDALVNWLGEAFDDETTLSILRVDLNGLTISDSSAGYELVCLEGIPSSALSIAVEDLDAESDLAKMLNASMPSHRTPCR